VFTCLAIYVAISIYICHIVICVWAADKCMYRYNYAYGQTKDFPQYLYGQPVHVQAAHTGMGQEKFPMRIWAAHTHTYGMNHIRMGQIPIWDRTAQPKRRRIATVDKSRQTSLFSYSNTMQQGLQILSCTPL